MDRGKVDVQVGESMDVVVVGQELLPLPMKID
jgi:hypothetical protein